MSYSKFQEICNACYISRNDIEYEYNKNSNGPWSYNSNSYDENKRNFDANKYLYNLFLDYKELDLEQLSKRIFKYKEKLINEKVIRGGIWSTIGNVNVAIAKSAAILFNGYVRLLPENSELNYDEIRELGKPSPYRDMKFPTFFKNPDGSFIIKGEHHADYQAASDMYEGNLLALLIAREYGFEACMP